MGFTVMRDAENQDNPIYRWLSKVDPNFLSKDLSERIHSNGLAFNLNVQLEKDPESTPIEDNLKEWTEVVSPSIPVGLISFPPQNIDSPEQQALCQQMRFTPGHYVSQHRPLSNLGRGRIFTYAASAGQRGASGDMSEQQVLDILKRNQVTPK